MTRRGMPTNREANFRARLERHQANVETSAGLAQLQEAKPCQSSAPRQGSPGLHRTTDTVIGNGSYPRKIALT